MSLEKKETLVEVKKPWQSKTNWTGLLIALASFFPSVHTWVAANPDAFMQIVAGVTMILRFVSKGKITIE